MSETIERLEDRDAIDAIATLLGTSSQWSSAADYLEDIANIIGKVRPHPGDNADTYAQTFELETGRPVPQNWVGDEGKP